jgi:hypothetical protein
VTRVRMLTPIRGTVEGRYDGVAYGDIIDVDLDARAQLWIAQKMAVAVDPDTPTTGRLKPGLSDGDSRYAHY